MKTAFLTIAAIILFFDMGAFAQTAPATHLTLEKGVAPHKKIDNIYRRFSEAYKDLDPQAVTDLYTSDAFYLSPGGEIKRGSEKILADFTGFFDSVKKEGRKLEISFRILDRRVSGKVAYDVGIFTLTNSASGGDPRTGSGKFVVVAQEEKGGVWKFHVDSYSDLPREKK